MKKILSFVIFIIWIFLIFIVVQNFSAPSKGTSPQIKTLQVFKIAIEDKIENDFKKILSNLEKENKNFQFNILTLNENPEIIITSDESQIPTNFQKEIIFEKEISLSPESFAANFNERLQKLTLWLGWQNDKNITPFKEQLSSSLKNLEEQEIEIVAVGDIMLSRHVGEKIKENGPKYPFLKTSKETSSSDLTFGNLESPYNLGEPILEGMVFKALPEAIDGLKYAGFDLLNLANNHCGDQGTQGLKFTFKHLTENKIDYFGAGENFKEAHQAKILEVKGTKIAFLGYTDTDVIPEFYGAGQNRPGCALINIAQLKKDIENAKKQQPDVIVISMHSGTEYKVMPNQSQINFAHQAAENGADVVIGHHPHVVQAIEIYQGKFIFYSLGNFIFDQAWSKETSQGLILNLKILFNHLVSAKLIPVHIENSQPYLASLEESNEILNRIFEASKKL